MLDIATDTHVNTVSAIVARVARQHEVAADIAPGDSLVDKGLTSMAMVDLMLAMEMELDIMIPQREMTPANFQSIESLARLLARLRHAS